MRDNSTETRVNIRVWFADGHLARMEKEGTLEKLLKLKGSKLSTRNMYLFDQHDQIRENATCLDILQKFYDVRVKGYVDRKNNLVDKLSKKVAVIKNKVNFIRGVIKGDIKVSNRKQAEIVRQLKTMGFQTYNDIFVGNKALTDKDIAEVEESEKEGVDVGYKYLLSMPIYSLTLEKITALEAELAKLETELNVLHETTPTQIWERDMDAFLAEWEVRFSFLFLFSFDQDEEAGRF